MRPNKLSINKLYGFPRHPSHTRETPKGIDIQLITPHLKRAVWEVEAMIYELTQSEDRVAEVNDAVTMGDEDHSVVWELGCETFKQQ